uniref:Reverse transcriptase domain-containing protein n=1 Tax=Tanacetum cinerariifolium TaxID=118510 RepID=A0A6L2N865_TANCI|nr:hypothetical protein [Tanacetum cinerariifolium]
MTSLTSMCEVACQIVQKNLEEKQLEEEQAAKAQNRKLPVCYDDDDDKESSKSLEDNIISKLLLYSVVTPSKPVDSLNKGDEHLNTILITKSDEFIKSCVENLVPNPSDDDQSTFDEDVPKKIYSNPLFDEEINPMKIDQHSFNAESDLIESMTNHDSSIIISSKIDSLLDEFAGELTLLKSIPLGIDETDCHHENETRFAKRLLYDNSSPRPPEEIVFDNSNADIESFSPSPIPVEDSDFHMEEIDLPFTPDDPMPSDGNTGTLNIKMMGEVFDQKVPIPGLTITRILNKEKSLDLLSHQGLEAFQPSAECPMIINGKNIPLLDVPLFHFYRP